MTGTTRIPAAEITGFKGMLIKRFARRSLGQVPTSLGIYWHNQKVLMGMAGVGGKVQKWDACDEQLKSFAHMAVAAQVGCSWCLDFNYFEAHNKKLDLAKAREMDCGLRPSTTTSVSGAAPHSRGCRPVVRLPARSARQVVVARRAR